MVAKANKIQNQSSLYPNLGTICLNGGESCGRPSVLHAFIQNEWLEECGIRLLLGKVFQNFFLQGTKAVDFYLFLGKALVQPTKKAKHLKSDRYGTPFFPE